MQKNFSLFDDSTEEKISVDKKISVTFAEYKDTVQVESDDLFKNFPSCVP